MRAAFDKAVADLDRWTQRYHDTDYSDERAYYYMLAYNGLNQPAKVVDTGAPLLLKPVSGHVRRSDAGALRTIRHGDEFSEAEPSDAGPIGDGADGGEGTACDSAHVLHGGAPSGGDERGGLGKIADAI